MSSHLSILLCLLIIATALMWTSDGHRLSPEGLHKRAYHFFRIRRGGSNECITIPDYLRDALENPGSLCPEDRALVVGGL